MFVEPLCPLFGRSNVWLGITAGYVRSTGRMAELKVQQHPGKTFVGRISRGFDFLGYCFSAAGLVGVAVQTVVRCVERMTRLYEQGADAGRRNVRLAITGGCVRSTGRMAKVPHGWVFHYPKNRSTQ
jgi:hypothetical protein